MFTAPQSIAVLYITDQNYHGLTERSIASVSMMSTTPVDFHIFQVDYDGPVSSNLNDYIIKHGNKIFTKPFFNGAGDKNYSQVALFPHIAKATLYKAAAIQELTADYAQIAYLDPDVVAMRPIDLTVAFPSEKPAAAVYDFVSYMNYDGQDIRRFAEESGLSGDYFNAGVIFVDSNLWNQHNILDLYDEALFSHSHGCPYRRNATKQLDITCMGADQCALNMALDKKWEILPLEYNAQKPIRHTNTWQHALLRHYTGPNKINYRSNRYRDSREANLLKKMQSEVSIDLPFHNYDQGIQFFIDKLRYTSETRKYKSIVNALSTRVSNV